MSKYLNEFNKALARTSAFGLPMPYQPLELNHRWLTPKAHAEFPYVIRDAFGAIGAEDLVAQCLSIHYRLKGVIQDWLGCPIFYTIGWIDDQTPNGLFKFDDSDIDKWLRGGHQGGSVNMHAWLTLPSMELFDLSLATSIAVAKNLPEGLGGVIAKHADEVTDMAYRPMLIGEEFLKRSGLLVQF